MNLFSLTQTGNKMETLNNNFNFLFTRKKVKISNTNADIKMNKTSASFTKRFLSQHKLVKGDTGSFGIFSGELCFVHSTDKVSELFTIQVSNEKGVYITYPSDAREIMSKYIGSYKVKSIKKINNEISIYVLQSVTI